MAYSAPSVFWLLVAVYRLHAEAIAWDDDGDDGGDNFLWERFPAERNRAKFEGGDKWQRDPRSRKFPRNDQIWEIPGRTTAERAALVFPRKSCVGKLRGEVPSVRVYEEQRRAAAASGE